MESFVRFKMDTSEFSAEKTAVMIEIRQNEVEDVWKDYYTTLQQQLFGPRIPIACATPEERIRSVKRLKARDVTTFRDEYYGNPERYTLVVAGDFSPSLFLRDIEHKFVTPFLLLERPTGSLKTIIPCFPLAFQDGTMVYVKNKNHVPNVKIVMIWGVGNRITPSDVARCAAINLLSSLLYTRLYEIVRVKEKMVYGVDTDFDPDYYGSGLFSVEAETAKKNRTRLIDLVEKELKKLSTTRVPSTELEGVKNKERMRFFKARQDTSPEKFADFYSDPVSLGQPRLTYTRLYHAYLTISPRDILQASKDILKCPRLVVYSE
jgi:predicted Zn-dependent peptidase